MNWALKTFASSVGQKFLVGLTGLLLIGFLIVHLVGNLTIYLDGAHGISHWAEFLHYAADGILPLLIPMEIGLIGLFAFHIGMVIRLTLVNRAARGTIRYKVTSTKNKNFLTNSASKFMLISGLIIAVFLVVHLLDVFTVFKGHEHELHETLVDNLSGKNSWKAGLYTIGTLMVGVHVFHGFQSAIRSFGFNNGKYMPALTQLGMIMGIIFGLAFASIPMLIVLGVVN